MSYPVLETDVLVIGGGGAGARAAVAADEAGAGVAILTKGQISRSGTTPMACPSYQAAVALEDPRDSVELAFDDTCKEGRYLGDENLIWAMTSEATIRAQDMARYGLKYEMQDGRWFQVLHPGQSFPRNLVMRGCGYGMMVALKKAVNRRRNVQVYEDYLATRLLTNGRQVIGAVAIDLRTSRIVVFRAKATILATGGYMQLWEFTDTAPDATGDGVALAYRAGADLVDMEMMLYYPSCLRWPPEIEGTLVQYEGLVNPMYVAAPMLNGRLEEFLPKTVDEHGRHHLPVRDVMMRLMFTEIEAGRGTPNRGIYIYLPRSPRPQDELFKILHKLDSLPYNFLRDLEVDITRQPIEVAPGIHFALGGVWINERAETTLPGLYCAGENAGNVHGANRTSGNALAESQVFGERSGRFAAAWCATTDLLPVVDEQVEAEAAKLTAYFTPKGDALRPIEVKKRLKRITERYLAYQRDEEGMAQAQRDYQRLREDDLRRVQVPPIEGFNYEWAEAVELDLMIELGEIVAVSGRARKETRGHHWRTDYPATDPAWLKHVVTRRRPSGEIEVDTAPVVRLRARVDIGG